MAEVLGDDVSLITCTTGSLSMNGYSFKNGHSCIRSGGSGSVDNASTEARKQ